MFYLNLVIASTYIFISTTVLGHTGVSYELLKARQSPTIKQTVGTWQYKGCYKDFGSRILTFRFDVPLGNNAERCTSLCHDHGYGLAGLEYGTECWCDNYMPYGQLMSDSDCNFACPGDSTEQCGAGSRLALYQDTAATPPSPNTCITWRDGFSFGNNVLQAIPKSGLGTFTKLYAIAVNGFLDPIYYTIISTCPPGCTFTDYYNFGLVNSILTAYGSTAFAPNVGDSQAFVSAWPNTPTGYAGFCAKPNPVSPAVHSLDLPYSRLRDTQTFGASVPTPQLMDGWISCILLSSITLIIPNQLVKMSTYKWPHTHSFSMTMLEGGHGVEVSRSRNREI